MSSEQRPWLRSESGLVLLGFLAIAGFFLWEEHQAHLLGILPYGLLLLCPLMHLFHGGHGGHGNQDEQVTEDTKMTDESAYGLWSLVVINSLVFIIFAFSFRSQQTRDWRSFSAFSAFIVALFVEMYGFPSDDLFAFRLAGATVSGSRFFSHDAGHLWNTLLGWKINPHFDPLHILSNILIFGGFILLSAAWKVLYEAQRTKRCRDRPYAYVRHPQYGGFILIMLGFLLQWPTLVTLIMFPILVTMYVRLARREEREVLVSSVTTYRRYMLSTPAFFPW